MKLIGEHQEPGGISYSSLESATIEPRQFHVLRERTNILSPTDEGHLQLTTNKIIQLRSHTEFLMLSGGITHVMAAQPVPHRPASRSPGGKVISTRRPMFQRDSDHIQALIPVTVQLFLFIVAIWEVYQEVHSS